MSDDEDDDADAGPVSIHSMAAKANRAATPVKSQSVDPRMLRPKTEINRFNGVELTSIINMMDLEGGEGSKPLVDLNVGPKLDSGPRLQLDSGPRPALADSGPSVLPTLKGVGAIQDPPANPGTTQLPRNAPFPPSPFVIEAAMPAARPGSVPLRPLPSLVANRLRRCQAAARPGHESAGMGAGARQKQPGERTVVTGVAEERPHREQLIERELAVKHMTAAQPEFRLKFGRRQNFGGDDQGSNARRVRVERCQGVGQEHVLCHLLGDASGSQWRVMRVDRCNVGTLR
jgi:hypothetical protein